METCKYQSCGKPLAQRPGGRKREYCDDACRQAAHRHSHQEAVRLAAEQEVQRWGDFLPATITQLVGYLVAGSRDTARQLADTLLAEQQAARPDQHETERSADLLADFMQAGKKIGSLERQIRKYERLDLINTRESMLQELMVLGGRLKYASLTNLGIEAGIDQWLNYARGVSDSDLAAAIAHGYYQADTLAMAAIEANDQNVGMQMRRRINELERAVSLRDARIAELEDGQGEDIDEAGELNREQIQALAYHAHSALLTIEQQVQHIAELERKHQDLITRIHRLEESHGTTMFAMNSLLAAAQTAHPPQNDVENMRIVELEREVAHLHTRIEKQYVKKSAYKAEVRVVEQTRTELRQLSQVSIQAAEAEKAAALQHIAELTEQLEQTRRGAEQVQASYQHYVAMTNERVGKMAGELARYRQAEERRTPLLKDHECENMALKKEQS